MTTKRWILILIILAATCIGLLALQFSAGHGRVILISQDGNVIHTIDLSQVQEPYSITVEWNGSYNVLQITQTTVWVSEADCDNQVCVDHGPLTENGSPITCLPHHLTIHWAESQVDA